MRNTLIAFVVILFLGAGAGSYFAFGLVSKEAESVSAKVVEAEASNSLSDSLTALQATLAQQQEIAQLASGLYATSATWQTQVIKDINAYAAASGITVTDFNLTATAPTAAPAATPTDPAAAPAATGATPTQSFSVTLTAPVSYSALLKFMTYINNSIPKMQVTSAELTRSPDGNDTVTITTLTIGVFVR